MLANRRIDNPRLSGTDDAQCGKCYPSVQTPPLHRKRDNKPAHKKKNKVVPIGSGSRTDRRCANQWKHRKRYQRSRINRNRLRHPPYGHPRAHRGSRSALTSEHRFDAVAIDKSRRQQLVNEQAEQRSGQQRGESDGRKI